MDLFLNFDTLQEYPGRKLLVPHKISHYCINEKYLSGFSCV